MTFDFEAEEKRVMALYHEAVRLYGVADKVGLRTMTGASIFLAAQMKEAEANAEADASLRRAHLTLPP